MKTVLPILSLIFIILNILDVYTTVRALKQGGYEANPLVRFLMRKNLFIPVKAAAVIAVIILMATSDPQTALLTGSFCCLIYLAIVGNNLRTLVRLNRKLHRNPDPETEPSQKKLLP